MEPKRKDGELIERTLKIPYYYYENGYGLLDDTIPISVDKNAQENEADIRSRRLSYELDHPTLLRCFGRSEPSGDVVYDEYNESLAAFIEHNDPPLVEEFKVPALNCAEEDKLTYFCIPDVYKQIIRDAINFIIYLHDTKNESLSELELQRNFVVKGSSLRLWRLRYNESTTEARKNEDFKHLASVLRKVFVGRSVPCDFDHLLSCMDDYEESNGDRVLLENHLAVLRSGERLTMIKNLREKSFYLSSNQSQVYRGVFTTMTSDGQDWTQNLDGSHSKYELIKILFDSSKANYNFYISNDQITLRSLNVNAIKFCRDIAEHINDKEKKKDAIKMYKDNGEPFCVHEVECIIMAVFAKQLLSFQLEAKNRGALQWLI